MDRLVIGLISYVAFTSSLRRFGHKGGYFDFDLCPDVDQAADVEQRRARKIPTQRLLPGGADAGTCGFIFASAGQIQILLEKLGETGGDYQLIVA